MAAGGHPEPDPATAGSGPVEGSAGEVLLVRAARSGDAAAFGRLVEPLMQPAFEFAVRLLGDRQMAEDVVQDALLKAYSALAGFRGEARFRTWLFAIVYNACTDCLRRRARRRESPAAPVGVRGTAEAAAGVLPDVPDGAAGPEETVLERLTHMEILRAVDRLPADQRVAVLLRDVRMMSYGEIAAVTGQSLGTVKSRLHRARAALRAALAAAEGEGGRGGGSAGVPAAPGSGGQAKEPNAAVSVRSGEAPSIPRSAREAE